MAHYRRYENLITRKEIEEMADIYDPIKHRKLVNLYTIVNSKEVPIKWLYYSIIRKEHYIISHQVARLLMEGGYQVYAKKSFPTHRKVGIERREPEQL